jgi:ABC-type transport system substrate-binding protein
LSIGFLLSEKQKEEKNGMRKDLLVLAVSVMFAMLLISPAAATVNIDNFPRLDRMISIICNDEPDMITKALGGVVDTAYDIKDPANVALLESYGWSISKNTNYECGYIEINCRDVAPPESGSYYDYHGRTPGQSLFPLNISEFRYALHLLIGGAITDNALSSIFGWTVKRIDTVLSPAYGQWYDSGLPPVPYDPDQAMALLNSIGFYNTTGYWVNTNPDIGPTGELRTIYVLGCPEKAQGLTAMSWTYMSAWNTFFGTTSDGVSNYFSFDIIPEADMDYIVFRQRDFDICGLEFPLVGKCMTWPIKGRDPDYLFDFFHSSKDGVNNYNVPGISNAYLDERLYAIKYWRWPNGTYITNLDDMISIAWDVQEMLYYLSPCIPMYSTSCINAFAPGLMSWIESLGYGSDNWWTYNWIYWADTSRTSINQAVLGWPDTLNPLIAGTVPDWEILGRIYDSLSAIDPFLHRDINWAMSGYTIEPWSDSGLGVEYGQNVTVSLRHGITWHSGDLVTSADIKWNYDFIKHMELGRYSDIATTYYDTQIWDDYHFSILINCTGIWTVYTYFGSALLFPQEIWEPWWDDPVGAESWTPWTVNYDDWTGQTGHGDLTCLIGTGAWVFHDWDVWGAAASLYAYRSNILVSEFGFDTSKATTYWAGNFIREDLNFDGRVDLFDAVLLGGEYKSYPGSPRWNYGQGDLDGDGIVDVYDLRLFWPYGGRVTLPS